MANGYTALNHHLEQTLAFDSLPGLAHAFNLPPTRLEVCLMGVGGLIGSGKSTLAQALAEKYGAIIIRADAVRKTSHGYAADERLPQEFYTPEVDARNAQLMEQLATIALSYGYPVLLDTTFASAAGRRQYAKLAAMLDVPFMGIWCDIAVEEARRRLAARREAAVDKVSDAGPELLDVFKNTSGPTAAENWHHVNANGAPQEVIAQACAMIEQMSIYKGPQQSAS